MNSLSSERKCLLCQSKNLHHGSLGMHSHTFIPKDKFMLIGYGILAYVCLDCGTMGYYLNTADLQDLRETIKKDN
jgi:hypothetical protein